MLQGGDTFDNPWTSVLPVRGEVGDDLPGGRRDGANLQDDIGSTLNQGEGGEELHYRAEFADGDEENATGVARVGGGEPGNLRRRKFDGVLAQPNSTSMASEINDIEQTIRMDETSIRWLTYSSASAAFYDPLQENIRCPAFNPSSVPLPI